MESILPRDMVNLILAQLPDQTLFNYGLSCKTSLKSSSIVWKRKYDQFLEREKLEKKSAEQNQDINAISDQPLYWYKEYSKLVKDFFIDKLRIMLINQGEECKTTAQKTENAIKVFEHLVKFKPCLFIPTNLIFTLTVKDKLNQFLRSFLPEEVEISHKYFPILFPQEYSNTLQEIRLIEEEYRKMNEQLFEDESDFED